MMLMKRRRKKTDLASFEGEPWPALFSGWTSESDHNKPEALDLLTAYYDYIHQDTDQQNVL